MKAGKSIAWPLSIWESLQKKDGLLGRLFKPSTRSFLKEARAQRDFSVSDWLHGYVYGRWPYLYIGVGTGEHRLTWLFRATWNLFCKITRPWMPDDSSSKGVAFAETYHGKVVSLDEAKRIVTVNREIVLRDLEHVIPYAQARDIVLKNPDHIVVLDCPCRASRPNPCEPLDVCLVVGEPFAGFISEHHPSRSRWITQQEAVEILTAEHKRGHVHHAFFKDAMLGRFYAICNCCSCCCGAMQAWRKGIPMLASAGYVSQVDSSRCSGCGKCVKTCQFGAIRIVDGKARVKEDLCMGCGVCLSTCDQEAHSLVRDQSRGEPLEIQELIARSQAQGKTM
jgi:ferredoxin